MKTAIIIFAMLASVSSLQTVEASDPIFEKCDKFITAGAFPDRRMEFMCRSEFPMYVKEIAVHRCIVMKRKGFSDRLDYLVCKTEFYAIFKE